VLDDE